MSKMNQSQRNYAIEQIRNIASDKITVAKEKHTSGKTLALQEQINLIRTGKAKLYSKSQLTEKARNNWRNEYNNDINWLFDFSDKGVTFNEKKFRSMQTIIKKERDKLIDQIMLGDSEIALALIEGFRNS